MAGEKPKIAQIHERPFWHWLLWGFLCFNILTMILLLGALYAPSIELFTTIVVGAGLLVPTGMTVLITERFPFGDREHVSIWASNQGMMSGLGLMSLCAFVVLHIGFSQLASRPSFVSESAELTVVFLLAFLALLIYAILAFIVSWVLDEE